MLHRPQARRPLFCQIPLQLKCYQSLFWFKYTTNICKLKKKLHLCINRKYYYFLRFNSEQDILYGVVLLYSMTSPPLPVRNSRITTKLCTLSSQLAGVHSLTLEDLPIQERKRVTEEIWDFVGPVSEYQATSWSHSLQSSSSSISSAPRRGRRLTWRGKVSKMSSDRTRPMSTIIR